MDSEYQIGYLTELQCMTEFLKMGYNISLPYGGHSRYDFIADIEGKLIKIQVKHSKKIDNNSFSFPCFTYSSKKTKKY